jgi:putative endonuclease
VSTELGQRAEAAAARYLELQGLTIIERNWRTRWCEIDLVALDRLGCTHFVEVKYRKNPAYGSGFDYITRDKIGRLKKAALMWLSDHRTAAAFQIDVISVEGDLANPSIDYLPNALQD